MKSMLYVGAALMLGASVYGVVDYKKSSHKKAFTNMYAPEPKKELKTDVKPDPVVNPVNKESVTTSTVTKTEKVAETKSPEKTVTTKKRNRRIFRLSEFSRAPLREDRVLEVKTDDQDAKSIESKDKKEE